MCLYLHLLFILSCTTYCVSTTDETENPTVSNPLHYKRCDYYYSEEAKGWFKYHQKPADWLTAKSRCDDEGTILASPSKLKSNTMMSLMEKYDADNIFTGIHNLYDSSIFTSLEGCSLDYYNFPHLWADGEPNHANDTERRVKMDRSGRLAFVSKSLNLPYICYKKITEINNESRCNTFNDGYVYNENTSSCHKLHPKSGNFAFAFQTCYAEGGYLTIINSVEESNHIAHRIVDVNIYLYVGFSDFDANKIYRTVKGQTLAKAGFDQFEHFPYNNSCGIIHGISGLLNSDACYNSRSFVCEIDVKKTCEDC